MYVKSPGRQPSKSEQLLLEPLVRKPDDTRVIVHHVTQDTPYKLQLEIERYRNGKISFERITL